MPRDPVVSGTEQCPAFTYVTVEALDRHKAAEAELNGPSWWYRHQELTALLIVFGPLSVSLAIFVGAPNMFTGTTVLASIAWTIIFCCTSWVKISLHGGAEWIERPCVEKDLDALPDEVARIVTSFRQVYPDARLFIGELLRHEVILDPYLVAHLPGCDTLVCLGIWNNLRVVSVARMALED